METHENIFVMTLINLLAKARLEILVETPIDALSIFRDAERKTRLNGAISITPIPITLINPSSEGFSSILVSKFPMSANGIINTPIAKILEILAISFGTTLI